MASALKISCVALETAAKAPPTAAPVSPRPTPASAPPRLAGLGAVGAERTGVGANSAPGAGLAAANLRAPAVPAGLGAEGLVAGFRAGALVTGGHGRGGAAKAYLGLRHRAFCAKASDGGSGVTPAGTGTGLAAPGAGLGAKGTGTGLDTKGTVTGPVAPGAGLGAKGTGTGSAGLAAATGGLGVKGAAGLGLSAFRGYGRRRASNQARPNCHAWCQVINKEGLILEEVAGLRKELH
nr:spidroin-1-like [Aegilops tauschii subsp. strangulata]